MEVDFNVCKVCSGFLAEIGSCIVQTKLGPNPDEVTTTYICGNCAPHDKIFPNT